MGVGQGRKARAGKAMSAVRRRATSCQGQGSGEARLFSGMPGRGAERTVRIVWASWRWGQRGQLKGRPRDFSWQLWLWQGRLTYLQVNQVPRCHVSLMPNFGYIASVASNGSALPTWRDTCSSKVSLALRGKGSCSTRAGNAFSRGAHLKRNTSHSECIAQGGRGRGGAMHGAYWTCYASSLLDPMLCLLCLNAAKRGGHARC